MMMDDSKDKIQTFKNELTVGLVDTLRNVPGVTNLVMSDNEPSDNIAITSWEQRYSTSLPSDIRDFYLATDGFKIMWQYRNGQDVLPIGNMSINRIADLKRIAGLRHSFDTEHPTLLDLEIASKDERSEIKPQFGLRWKMFELENCRGYGRVVLVFPPKPEEAIVTPDGSLQIDIVPPTPQVWFLDRCFEWHFLASNFKTYFRMMLVHLGLPQWQALHTPFGPTPWAKKIINIIAPHLIEPITEKNNEDSSVVKIDQSVFRIKTKKTKSSEGD